MMEDFNPFFVTPIRLLIAALHVNGRNPRPKHVVVNVINEYETTYGVVLIEK
jgi:hypothetical protein